MKPKKKTQSKWNDKSSTYQEKRDPISEDLKHCKGICDYNGIKFKFSINQSASVSGYALRGSVKILNPNTGYILSEIQANNKEKACSCDLYIKSVKTPKSDIQAKIIKKVEFLYAKHANAIMNASHKHASTTATTLPFLFATHQSKWVTVCKLIKKGSQRSLDSAISLLREYFMLFATKYVSDISAQVIESARDSFDKRIRKAENLANDFWCYCQDYKLIAPELENPFKMAQPLSSNLNKKSSNRNYTISLSTSQELKLRSLIETNKTSPLYIGVCLILYGYLMSKDVFATTWERIFFDMNDPLLGCIQIIDKSTSHSTHDFSRPLFPYAVLILREYYDWLLHSTNMTREELNKCSIMADCYGNVRYTPKDLTALCRNVMPAIGVSHASLSSAGKSNPKVDAGITILHATYRNKLVETCRMEEQDPDAYTYMLCNSMTGNTTADHYRSFSSAEGILLLHKYTLRDSSIISGPLDEITINDIPSSTGTTIKEVHGHPASCTIKVSLKNGEYIKLSSGSMILASYRSKATKNNDNGEL
ncbi:MAG: hypothetical protein IKU32_04425 [Clostridia bacterium]|nr:hypothetical protein [Clostridia bacterium]